MTPEQTPTSNVDWEWYERGILEERKRQRAHIDTLTAAVERRVRSAYRTGWRDHEAGIRYREDEVAHDPT